MPISYTCMQNVHENEEKDPQMTKPRGTAILRMAFLRWWGISSKERVRRNLGNSCLRSNSSTEESTNQGEKNKSLKEKTIDDQLRGIMT